MALRITRKLLMHRGAVESTINVARLSTSRVVAANDVFQFPGAKSSFTNELRFVNEESYAPVPIYRILDSNGEANGSTEVQLEPAILTKMYRDMVTLTVMDKILYESQRQGRISFYMQSSGEEAVHIGTAAALALSDIIYAQYRETGVLLWRGYRMEDFMNQCYGNHDDKGKGRQMPIHYGSRELNFVTISSPLTTQLPQAVGAAYAVKRAGSRSCVAAYFGEGAASEGDAHAAFNFAATLQCPILFICRNNGYAISTPSVEQYHGDGIAAKGPAYGINTLRVDGNDVLAMYHATKKARDFSTENKKPVLIEAMTYRIGHHSTSDDSTAYRTVDEIDRFNKFSPITKFRLYLEKLGIWNEEKEKNLIDSARKEVLTEFSRAEEKLKPDWRELFTDVYCKTPNHIRKQLRSMERHVEKYKEHYPLASFKA